MKMKTIIKRLLLVILLLLILGIGYLIYHRYVTVNYTPQKYMESTQAISNPYKGWYHIYGYTLSDQVAIDPSSIISSYQSDTDTTLAMLEINLCNYPSGDISTTGLSQLDAIFTAWKKSNKQLIVRFLYDWDGKAKETEPENVSIVARHITQVATIVNQHKDCVYLMQGIFVGNCGEMNNSNYMSSDNMCMLYAKLASVIDPSIYLSVRTPAHWRTIAQSYQPLAKDQAFTGSPSARLGLFNDGMLGSGNDLGTYGDNSLSQATSYSDKGTRAEEIQFQNQLCSFVPNGGEVVLDNPFNDLDNALKDMLDMHVSYLDRDYDAAVINKWKANSYNGSDVFHGCNGYDYVTNHLGYRYVIQSSNVTFDTWKDNTATLSISMKNTGFSNCYRAFSTSILVKSSQSDQTFELPVSSDNRYWNSNGVTTFSVPLDIRNYETGTYDIYLKIVDPTNGGQIKLANELEASNNGYNIASIKITK
jgi:hypothetical protein